MNPHKMNKVDVKSMSAEDQKAFAMYGKVPAKNLLTKMQKERKYFDSGDYAMSQAGIKSAQAPGTAIPTPAALPHAMSPNPQSPPPSHSPPASISIPAANAFRDPFGGGAPINTAQTSPNSKGGGNLESGNVGVGISPAATTDSMDIPNPVGPGHARRSSESHNRTSPPGFLREGSTPSSSFPIQHSGSFGSSPVKSSNLGKRVEEENES